MIEQYTIALSDLNVAEVLGEWRWLLPATYEPKILTKFGDWFFDAQNGRIQFLDLLEGTLNDLCAVCDFQPADPDFIETYKGELSVDWVEVCRTRNLMLGPGQCFGWRVHPMLGGRFESANIQVFTLAVYESMLGQSFRQIKGQGKEFKITGFSVGGSEKK